MLVVAVRFEIKPEHLDAFRDAILANARNSVANEPGCQQFDVCHDPENTCAYFLYEIYNDPAAFESHKASDHYKAFAAAAEAGDWIVARDLKLYHRL